MQDEHAFAPRIGVEPGTVVVRELGYRWWLCGHNEILNFHRVSSSMLWRMNWSISSNPTIKQRSGNVWIGQCPITLSENSGWRSTEEGFEVVNNKCQI
jgi:hypothetical protein